MGLFLYDFEKSIFDLTRPPRPLGGHKPNPKPVKMLISAPKWLYLGEFLTDLDEIGVEYH